MTEWLMIACMGIGGVGFAVGGTGFKWVRRYLMPLLLGGIALISGIIWWKCLAMAVSMIVALSLPYGDRTPYWLKFIVFMTYPASTLWLGLSWWQPITALVCFGVFCLSNWKPTENTFVWKICEFIMGSSIGITVASLISGHPS